MQVSERVDGGLNVIAKSSANSNHFHDASTEANLFCTRKTLHLLLRHLNRAIDASTAASNPRQAPSRHNNNAGFGIRRQHANWPLAAVRDADLPNRWRETQSMLQCRVCIRYTRMATHCMYTMCAGLRVVKERLGKTCSIASIPTLS